MSWKEAKAAARNSSPLAIASSTSPCVARCRFSQSAAVALRSCPCDITATSRVCARSKPTSRNSAGAASCWRVSWETRSRPNASTWPASGCCCARAQAVRARHKNRKLPSCHVHQYGAEKQLSGRMVGVLGPGEREGLCVLKLCVLGVEFLAPCDKHGSRSGQHSVRAQHLHS